MAQCVNITKKTHLGTIKKIKEMLCQVHQPGGFLPGVSFQAQQLLGAACL